MVTYVTMFGVAFLLATVAFTVWITRISLAADRHAPAGPEETEDPETSSG